ncbi:MAG: SEC-C metal-binding domain-containing protein, partial [Actinomycetota bacterium]
ATRPRLVAASHGAASALRPAAVAAGAQDGTQEPSSAGPARSDKVPRNAPCPCGSGRKYKKCHGAEQ